MKVLARGFNEISGNSFSALPVNLKNLKTQCYVCSYATPLKIIKGISLNWALKLKSNGDLKI